MTDKMQIDNMLVLSTNHIPWRTSRALDVSTEGGKIEGDGDMPATITWASYGWMVWADSGFQYTEASRTHAELQRVIEFAISHGCQWIRFDIDGPEIAGLPTFDWDAEKKAAKPTKCCCKCGGPITTPLLKDEDERCVHCADYSEDDPDAAELDDSRLFDERQAFVDEQNAARDTEEV